MDHIITQRAVKINQLRLLFAAITLKSAEQWEDPRELLYRGEKESATGHAATVSG